MKRLVPYPLVTLALLLMWLVLNGSVDPAHVLLGLVAGLAGGLVYARLEPRREGARMSLWPVPMLAWLVLLDIVRSNIAVARISLHLSPPTRVAGFLPIPLDLRDPRGVAVLACIVTATPGTSWAHYDVASNVLTLHVLDLTDKDVLVQEFKTRYERRLMEIFE